MTEQEKVDYRKLKEYDKVSDILDTFDSATQKLVHIGDYSEVKIDLVICRSIAIGGGFGVILEGVMRTAQITLHTEVFLTTTVTANVRCGVRRVVGTPPSPLLSARRVREVA